MKTIRFIPPAIKPSRYIEFSMTESDKAIEKQQKSIAWCINKFQTERDLAEQQYAHNNVCCGYVLPYNGICDICGKRHEIVR